MRYDKEISPFVFDFRCQWPEWLSRGYNWKNFTFVKLEYEHDVIMGGLEIEVWLLGFGLRVRWNFEVTKVMAECQEQMKTYTGCQHDWWLDADYPLGPAWTCRGCECSTLIPKP